MWAKKLAAMLIAAVMIFSAATPAFAEWKNGYDYDWEKGVVRTFGIGIGPSGANPKGSFYKSFARQAAKLDALRNFAEFINGTDEGTVDFDKNGNKIIVFELETNGKIMELLSKARIFGEAKFDEYGNCEIIMEMPLPKK